MIRAQQMDVNPSNPVRVWKTLYGGVFKIKESVPLLEKGDHIRVPRTKERSEKGFDPSMYMDYYKAQAGSGLPGFQGVPVVYGVGVGGMFCSFCQNSQK